MFEIDIEIQIDLWDASNFIYNSSRIHSNISSSYEMLSIVVKY